jgi:TolB-like protein/class 3 adenylate cyclase/Tfp pilus assembly protein PilF
VSDSGLKQRLEAILAADVAGYSRLMAVDERATVAALELARATFKKHIESRQGRVIDMAGDSVLAVFETAGGAMSAALAIQQELARTDPSTAEDRRMRFRIGVHLGDVIEKADGAVYGDGVNIAARLQVLADPGGITVSDAVKSALRGGMATSFVDRGEQAMKNIAQPVHVHAMSAAAIAELPSTPAASGPPFRRTGAAVRIGALAAGVLVLIAVGAWWYWPAPQPATVSKATGTSTGSSAPRLSIVVLPFANLGGDPGQDYFVDAITENLTTDLSRISGSFVIARNSAFTYKGKAVDARQVGRELNVRYVLEGSVQRSGESVRVNAQLIDAGSGQHLWAERFDKPRGDALRMQDEITARLARTLNVELVNAESIRGRRERPDNPDAVDLAMRGWSHWNRGYSRETFAAAAVNFEDALRIDPQQTDALIGLAAVLIRTVGLRWNTEPDEKLLARGEELIRRALTSAPNSAVAHLVKGDLHRVRKEQPVALDELETAIALDRNFALAHAQIGIVKIQLGRSEEAFAPVETAIRLSPRDPLLNVWVYIICHAHEHLAHDAEAIEWCRKSVAIAPFWFAYVNLAASYAHLGQQAEAKAAVAELQKLMPGFTVHRWASTPYSDNPLWLKQYARITEGLRKAGLPEK